MKWEVGDVTNLDQHGDGAFTVALDKGEVESLTSAHICESYQHYFISVNNCGKTLLFDVLMKPCMLICTSIFCKPHKGTLDALFADTEASTVGCVRRMFAEISRVLKFAGRYVCLTLAQDFIAEEFVNWFCQDRGWILRIQRVFDMERGVSEWTEY